MTPEDHSGGPVRCEQLGPFVDGELAPTEAAAFRKHLLICARCQQEMHGLMQLSALAEQARMQPRAKKAEVSPVAIAAADRRARPRRAAWVGVVGAVAMAAALMLALRGHRSGPDVPTVLASLDARTVSGWPSAMGPGQYRAYQTMRGTTAPAGQDALAQAQLRFEATGDLRALATVSLLRRDFAAADTRLASLPQTPDVLADRGLVRLEQSRCGEALEFLDRALFEQPQNLPARFNRALCLKQLRLPFAAERALALVASGAAGGWSEEAKQEERRLDRSRADFVVQEKAARATQEALVREQTPLPDAFIAARPSQSRFTFYHAVSSAPGRPELERLRSTAQALDRAFGTQDMEHRLDRVLRAVRPERAPLAVEYRTRILEGKLLPAAQVDPLRDAALKAGQDDIALQLIDQFENLDVSATRERLAKASGDPWHAVRLSTARARELMERGRAGEAERVLRAALDGCRPPSMAAACYYGQEALGDLYVRVGRPADARRVYADAALRLQASALYPQQRKALMEVARITAMGGEVALARATFEELQLREPERCLAWAWARELVAKGHVRAHDAVRAKATVQEPVSCTLDPEPWRAEWRMDLGRLEGDPQPIREGKEMAEAVVAMLGAAPVDVQEARLLQAEADVLLGTAGAEEELAQRIDRIPAWNDAGLRSAGARARQVLAMAAVQRGDARGALEQLARLQSAVAPDRCVVGFVSDVASTGWVTAGPDGVPRTGWKRTDALPTLSSEELTRLQSCPGAISVLVAGDRPVGTALPDGMAWAFRVGAGAPAGALGTQRLLVRDVLPPADLQLPPLGGGRRGESSGWTVLSGAEATPARVLAQLRSADVVDFEVHGIVDAQVPDGAVLVLSEDAHRDYALSATELHAVRLERRPVVFLGACRAATPSRLRAEPWSLPGTLVRSGARAVYASLQDLPDHEVGEFFQKVTTRLDMGEAPAIALRNERLAWVNAGKPWVRDVVLFD